MLSIALGAALAASAAMDPGSRSMEPRQEVASLVMLSRKETRQAAVIVAAVGFILLLSPTEIRDSSGREVKSDVDPFDIIGGALIVLAHNGGPPQSKGFDLRVGPKKLAATWTVARW